MYWYLLNAYPFTFQLIIKTLFFLQSSSTLWSMPTNQPHHTLFRNNKSHHYRMPFLLLPPFALLLLHRNSHTTNSISFSRPPQLISPFFHPQHPSALFSPSHLLHATPINLPLSQFFTNFSPFPLRLPKFYVQTRTPKRSSGLPSDCKLSLHAPGTTFLFMVGRCRPPQPSGYLTPTITDCHGLFEQDDLQGACPCLPLASAYRTVSVPTSSPLPPFYEMWWKTSSGRQECHILRVQIGHLYSNTK